MTTKALPRLLAISDRRSLAGPDAAPSALLPWADGLRQAGVDALQVREKDLDDRALYELVRQLRDVFPPPGRLLVNGRLDVALAAGADGAHLPANAPPTAALRRRFGAGPLLGRSTHAPQEVERELREGADYVVFGPVFPTPGKAAYGPPPGLPGLQRAAGHGLPVFALGGVTAERFAAAAEAGAWGAAGIRLFQQAESDLRRAVALAREVFPRPSGTESDGFGGEP